MPDIFSNLGFDRSNAQVLIDHLIEQGYLVEFAIINSCAVGVSQCRERLYLHTIHPVWFSQRYGQITPQEVQLKLSVWKDTLEYLNSGIVDLNMGVDPHLMKCGHPMLAEWESFRRGLAKQPQRKSRKRERSEAEAPWQLGRG